MFAYFRMLTHKTNPVDKSLVIEYVIENSLVTSQNLPETFLFAYV